MQSVAGAAIPNSVPSIRRKTARHEEASHHYGATGSKILELAKNAHNLLVLRDSHEQACLLRILVSNCLFDRGSLSASYIKPSDLLVEGNESRNWLGGRDSNPDTVVQSLAQISPQHFTLNSAGSYASCDANHRSVTSSASPLRRA
jgi:hypothetical protein